MNTLYKWRYK